MKTKLTILKLTILVCGTVVATAAFGQTTYTWTAAGTAPTNLDQAANWTPSGGPPLPGPLDWMEFNGVTGNTPQILTVGTSGALGGTSGFTPRGLTAWLTANQTALVQIGTRGGNNSGTIRMNGIQLDAGAGPFILGDNDNTHFVDIVWGGVSGQIQELLNNSLSTITIYPNVQFRMGGGGTHNFVFDGSGNFQINHYLTSQGGGGTLVSKLGSGTLSWFGTNTSFISLSGIIISPVVFNEGTIVLQTSDLLKSQQIQNNGSDPVWLQYNAPTDSRLCNLSGIISGPISVSVLAGNLQLSAANTFSGNVTNAGGELIVSNAENPGISGPLGVGGTISFTGGTLGYSAVNTYDYSSRFNTAAGQAYSIDVPANGLVQFATGLTSSGGTLTKKGPGTLTLAGANTYSGLTTVSAGKLVIQGSKTGSGNISVADGAALGVTATGTAIAPATLTLGTASGCTLEFNNVNSTVNAPLAAGTLSSAGTIAININSGTLAVGQCYPLFTWTNGPAPTVSLGFLNGYTGNLSFTGKTLYLCITSLVYTWTGAADGTNFGTAGNWNPNGLPSSCAGDTAQWNGMTTTNLFLINNYNEISGCDGALGINLVLTANQTNSVNMRSAVPISPARRIKGITIASGAGAFSLGDNTLNALSILWGGVSGEVQYFVNNSANPATFYPNVYLRNGGGGTHTLLFDGTGDWHVTNYLVTANTTPTLVTKQGSGTMVWNGKNVPNSVGNSVIASPVTINAGTLILQSGDLLGTQNIVNNGTLLQYDAGSSAVPACILSGVISGTGPLMVSSGTLTLAGANTYSGSTMVNGGTLVVNSVSGDMNVSGGTLAPAAAGTIGTLTVAGNMNLSAGTVLATLNKSLSPSNNSFVVAGAINSTGGALKLLNYGPALVAGDKFQIFNQAVTGSMTVLSPGFTVVNNGDGSFTVQTVAPAGSGVIAPNFSGGHLNLSWPAIWTGLHVQVQTNSLAKGLGTNWVTIQGTDTGNSYSTTPNNSNGSVFYRLAP